MRVMRQPPSHNHRLADQFARLIARHQQSLLADPPQCLYDIFRELQRWLETNPVENMDVDMSGTTLTAAFVLHVADPEQAADSAPLYESLRRARASDDRSLLQCGSPLLVVAHVGDSSALLASVKHTPKQVWKLNELTECAFGCHAHGCVAHANPTSQAPRMEQSGRA